MMKYNVNISQSQYFQQRLQFLEVTAKATDEDYINTVPKEY